MPAHARISGLLHVKEAAAELHVHPATVRRAIRAGDLPAVRLGPRGRLRVHREALERFLVDVEPSNRKGSG